MCACTRRALGTKDSFGEKKNAEGLKKETLTAIIDMGANCGMVVKTLLTGEGRRRNMYALFSTQRIPLTADNPSTSPSAPSQKDRV